jgi:amidase
VSQLYTDQRVDAWLLPLDPTVPAPIAGPRAATSTMPDPTDPGYDLEVGYTALASFTGLPAICYPAGRTLSGAPLAMQLVGPRWSESTLIRLAGDVSDHLDYPALQLQ